MIARYLLKDSTPMNKVKDQQVPYIEPSNMVCKAKDLNVLEEGITEIGQELIEKAMRKIPTGETVCIYCMNTITNKPTQKIQGHTVTYRAPHAAECPIDKLANLLGAIHTRSEIL